MAYSLLALGFVWASFPRWSAEPLEGGVEWGGVGRGEAALPIPVACTTSPQSPELLPPVLLEKLQEHPPG